MSRVMSCGGKQCLNFTTKPLFVSLHRSISITFDVCVVFEELWYKCVEKKTNLNGNRICSAIVNTNWTHYTSVNCTYISSMSVWAALPWVSLVGGTVEAEASGQEVEGGGRSDPCVFVLECESMSVSMTQPLKHTPLNWNQSWALCVWM